MLFGFHVWRGDYVAKALIHPVGVEWLGQLKALHASECLASPKVRVGSPSDLSIRKKHLVPIVCDSSLEFRYTTSAQVCCSPYRLIKASFA